MESYEARYKKLNTNQKQAVDLIEGPLLVIAGPGTGKTELLSMRAAKILRETDILPQNILCLTFTDSGATAIRSRLASIIGADAYKVAIHTFHSFGTEVINQNREYFYRGADFSPADDVAKYEILNKIFVELPYDNPLASMNEGEFVYLHSTADVIGELKKSGLSSDELLQIIDSNEKVLDEVESDLANVFRNRISKATLNQLQPIAEKIANIKSEELPIAITPLSDSLGLSLARALGEAAETGKTTPITKWKSAWMKRDQQKGYIFEDRIRQKKLRAIAPIYDEYKKRFAEEKLFDFDDMILDVVHAIENHPDLKYNLQEQYQYIMVDEFQDTNLAQLRIIFNLTDDSVGDAPNVMAVGDDDQAIYGFQGADVGNIHRFRKRYESYKSVILTDNYRSSQTILNHAREVIQQSSDRLEQTMNIDKNLTSHAKVADNHTSISAFYGRSDEYLWIANSIKNQLEKGIDASEITVIAREHKELVALLPYLYHQGIAVNYERRNNIFDDERIITLENILRVCHSIHIGDTTTMNALLPEIVAHPMFGFESEDIWHLGLQSSRNRQTWLETMLAMSAFHDLATWLLNRARAFAIEPLEQFIDSLIGVEQSEEEAYHSPFYEYYFNEKNRDNSPEDYLTALEALSTLRGKLREREPSKLPHARELVEFIDTYRELNLPITSVRRNSEASRDAINLMTAHKAKGLEFDTVYIINSVDSNWGEKINARSRNISYPENLPIAPNSGSYDERVRLFFVAMTRAKRQLFITYSLHDDKGKDNLRASFLADTTIEERKFLDPTTTNEAIRSAEIAWHERLASPISASMKELLAPTLEHYKLSATNLNNFIDVTNGGPHAFLMNNLLHFPQAKSSNAIYGTLIHKALQDAHDFFVVNHKKKAIDDIVNDFSNSLKDQNLEQIEFEKYNKRGQDALRVFLDKKYGSFSETQKSELNFKTEDVVLGQARLTGSLDLVDFKDNTIFVTDYKTGKAENSWKKSSVKLHKYRQQLMFYELLCRNSRSYAKYNFGGATLQFVEPDEYGELYQLNDVFSEEELQKFEKLIAAVWYCITTVTLPDISGYEANAKGVRLFEDYLIDNYSEK